MDIRTLHPDTDLDHVIQFYSDAPDYWELAEGKTPGPSKAKAFFTDGPPGCDPDASYRLGLFFDDRLSGLAEVSFGFPLDGDAYLGLMMLGQWARGKGHGAAFLSHIETTLRTTGYTKLYLAVMASNPQGRAFWEREGFIATGLSGAMTVGRRQQTLHRLVKPL